MLQLIGYSFSPHGLSYLNQGDESVRIENLSDAQVQAEALAVLQEMYPGKTIPEPQAFYFYRWHSDPLYRGSYSNWPASFYVEHVDNLRDPVENVYFAGEATSYEYYGFLQGAYTEGERVGQTIAQCLLSGCASAAQGADVRNDNKPFPPWYDPQAA